MMTPFSYFPIVLRLDNRSVLLVGGGQIAVNKMRLLLGRCHQIYIWATDVHEEIRRYAQDGKVVVYQKPIDMTALQEMLPQMALVFAATDDGILNRQISQLAQEHNVPVCAVDDQEVSSFITPALVDRSPVQVAISTGGASPVLARRLRERLERDLPAGLGQAALFMQKQRAWLKAQLPVVDDRRRVWEDFVDGSGYEAALAGEHDMAQEILHHLVTGHERQGEVWLVGAGPGHPDLLTLAALRLMQNADSVLYDNLVSDEILERVRRDAERVYVGKKKSHHSLPQRDIEAEMLRRARRGERVLRLKGGDPFIFGRGGEEMEALLQAGIPVRVVPGVTAASGCGAAAGIPLTHRDCAQSCVFVTGHARADGTLNLHWPSLARKGQTVVVYMGLTLLSELCAQLKIHGLPGDWPMAVIQRGTYPDQQIVAGTLDDVSDRVHEVQLQSPVTIIIGEVVRHRGEGRFPNFNVFSAKEVA
ncbi:uroporphyrinogen-III C-methyltransferase [Saccharibacter sp. 17.LH.SD]|uniref:siroheme synthase CysG n=1 Tax=Saccharibacter sp. 17.LH.SD TaxID=2689393 RepID=UPI0013698173|nr:siroheme synthase CysG [Saccharibacter sp. 17.LH.SD]MXV45094.1 uroporphyrinogen-III C-methyltransferase [Saccharibacter sp. 17.LH.SD]